MDEAKELLNRFAWKNILDEIGPVQATREAVNNNRTVFEFETRLPVQTICPEYSMLLSDSFTRWGVG